jgi:hypothetical protein
VTRAEVNHHDLLDPGNWPTDETPITPGWRFVSIGFETDPTDIGDGLNPWTSDWGSTTGWIVVAHPSYPWQRHSMSVYEVDHSGRHVVFAAGELSNGVWGFFVPEDAETA